jgi:hypothetical protein
VFQLLWAQNVVQLYCIILHYIALYYIDPTKFEVEAQKNPAQKNPEDCILWVNPYNSLKSNFGRLLFGQFVGRGFLNYYFLFVHVNQIFPKLSGNTKHTQFQLCMSPWWIFVQKPLKMQFSSIFVGLLAKNTWIRFQRRKGLGCPWFAQKSNLFYPHIM